MKTHYFRNNKGFSGGLKTIAINTHGSFAIYENGRIQMGIPGVTEISLKRARSFCDKGELHKGAWREVNLRRR